MKEILEKLNPQLFKRSETGREGVPISRLLSETGKIEDSTQLKRITSRINKFFDEKPSGFTYEKFKDIIKPKSLSSKKEIEKQFVFGIGSEERSKIKKFAKEIELRIDENSTKLYYDEYVETFFMYLYYQLFVKLFNNTDVIIKKNESSIQNAKKIISKIDESLKADTEENLANLYRKFSNIFVTSMANPKELLAGNDLEMVQYFENFANQNVRLFIDYPISEFIRGSEKMNMEDFIDEIFDSMESLNSERSSNKQIASINVLSDFIKGDQIEFDIVALQEKISSISQVGNKIKFPTKVEVIINDTIEELSSMEDISEIGMSWAKGTKWEPYIRLVCAIVSLESISESVKTVAKKVKGSGKYTMKIDIGEADKGLYFINAKAFSMALSETEEISHIVKDLNTAIMEMQKKTAKVQNTEGSDLIEMLFSSYSDDLRAMDIESMDQSQRNSIQQIMKITGLMEELAKTTMNEAVSEINKFLFMPEDAPRGLKPRNREAIENTMINVGDVILHEVRSDPMKFFMPTDVWKSIKEIGSSIKGMFGKVFDTTFSSDSNDKGLINNVIDSFNSEFSSKFNFLRMEKDENDPEKIKIFNKKRRAYSIDFNNIDEFKEYVKTMCYSIPSVMYHSKVCFPPDQNNENKYNTYFNMLSWFVRALEKGNKSVAVQGAEYPFAYIVTPFFLETVKYSLRGFINDAHNIIEIDEKLKKQIQESMTKTSMTDEEWKPLVEKFSKEIQNYLKLNK